MSLDKVVLLVMAVFMVVGAVDRVMGNRFGYGREFENGFQAMGSLALVMVGIYCGAPILAQGLQAAVGPLMQAIGAAPSIMGSILISVDSGGYPLAQQMAASEELANFSAIVVGSTMALVFNFNIPVGMIFVQPEDEDLFALGTMAGLISVPFACVIGGLMMGLPLQVVLANLSPIIAVALLVCVGLKVAPAAMRKGFKAFSWLMVAIIMAFLAAVALEQLAGVTLIPGMTPPDDVFISIGQIAIVLSGAYPLLLFVKRHFHRPLAWMGRRIGVNEDTMAGLLACCANGIAMAQMYKDMDPRGKVYSFAFVCCAGFVIGDHLAFVSSVEPDLVTPMLVCKLAGGVIGILIARLLYKPDPQRQVPAPEGSPASVGQQ